MIDKRGQVWVETVIYTLIGLALIGLVLAIIMPQIGKFKDKSTIEQTIDVLNTFDSKINDVLAAPGNARKLDLKMKRGDLFINSAEDMIIYELGPIDTRYSEPNTTIDIGNVELLTEKVTSGYKVTLSLNLSAYNLTYEGGNKDMKFSEVAIPYSFIIENNGTLDGKYQIDIRV